MSVDEKFLSQAHPLYRASDLVLVLDTPKGRGVFASQTIPRGTIVEVSPVLVFTEEEVEHHTSKTCLEHYTYYWPSPDQRRTTQAIALGLGSMFNHSTLQQNVTWSRDLKMQCITYTACRDIQAGEELCISYGHARLWFKDADVRHDDDYGTIERKQLEGHTNVEFELSGLGGIDL